MLYGAEFAVCSEINPKQIHKVWAELRILKFLNLLVHHVTSRLEKVKERQRTG
jgi:hypothetical protein